MSISGAFANARSGLTLNARAAELVGSNVANALTPNHARQEIVASSLRSGGVGISQVVRASDPITMATRLSARADADAATTMLGAQGQIAELTGSSDGETGLSSRLNQFGIALSQAGNGTDGPTALQSVLDTAQDVAQGFNDAANGLRQLRNQSDAAISDRVVALNDGLQAIATLNAEILTAGARRQDTAALEQQREAHIVEISGHIPLSIINRQDGQIALFSERGATLLDGSAATFGFDPSGVIGDGATISEGSVGGLFLNGLPMDVGQRGLLAGGGLAAEFELRDSTIPEAQNALDDMAGVMLRRLESADTTLSAGQGGILSDGSAGYDPAVSQGLASRIAVNPGLQEDPATSLLRLRGGLGGSPSTNANILSALTSALTAEGTDLAASGDLSSRDMAGHMSALSSSLHVTAYRAEQTSTQSTARALSADTAHSASVGVDSDQQLQQLLQIENAYAANARVIATADAMMQQLLEL